jgi:hypothetical protein
MWDNIFLKSDVTFLKVGEIFKWIKILNEDERF